MDPLNSELSQFYWILVSLKPEFTIKNNWEFIRFVKEGNPSFLSYKSSMFACNNYFHYMVSLKIQAPPSRQIFFQNQQ